MKLSESTLSVLKNFALINPNIVLPVGKTIRTLSQARNVFGVATIDEELPVQVPIYDLTSFLQSITLFENAELMFGTAAVTIASDAGEITYFYSDPSVVEAAPDKEIKLDSTLFNFSLSANDVNSIMRVAAALSAPMISFVSDGPDVRLTVSDRKVPNSNSFTRKLGKVDKQEFDFIIRVDNFKLLPTDYTGQLSKKGETGVVKLMSTDNKLTYFITVEKGSKI